MILFQNNSVKVEFDQTIPCIIWTPFEFMSGPALREPLLYGIDFYKQHSKEFRNFGWINNSKKAKGIKPEDLAWVVKNINPKYFESGGKKVAFVCPSDTFAKMSLRLYTKYTRENKEKLLVEAFQTIDEAKLWIKEQLSKA